MDEKSTSAATNRPTTYPKALLETALVLAAVTAVLHLYIGILVYGIPLGVPLILIALVYLGGIGIIAANNRRDLWLKIGVYWVMLVIFFWAASEAVIAPNTKFPLAYVDNAGKFIHRSILF